MNCPSRPDDITGHEGWNQSPRMLAGDVTTCQDLNGLANSRLQRDQSKGHEDSDGDLRNIEKEPEKGLETAIRCRTAANGKGEAGERPAGGDDGHRGGAKAGTSGNGNPDDSSKFSSFTWAKGNVRKRPGDSVDFLRRCGKVLIKFARFIGPGFMVSVAYIDPGNYSTDVAAGATFKFKLLFVILMSNLFAIFLQSLCVKLGTVTGLNLAENCKAHLPRWLNLLLYVFAEAAIIATDIAEVGT